MADVFLSYARADLRRAEQVKAALEGAGLTVFFDVDGLDGGDVFPDVLDREVKSAGAVVSLWSAHALTRPWVKQECSIGLKRKCLIPLAIEPLGDLDVPLAFEGLQQIDFTGFHGRTDSPEWQKLMRSLARALGRPDLMAGEAPAQRRAPSRTAPEPVAKNWVYLGWIGLGLLVLLFVGAQFVPGNSSQSPDSVDEELAAEPETFTEASAEPNASASEINSDTDDTGAAEVPIARVFDEYPGQACGDLRAQVYFEFDRTAPDISSVMVLEEALTRGFNCVLLEVRIEAHDDLLNRPSYAQAISERRANDLAALLVAKGVDAAIISTLGYGSSQPVEPGKRSPMNRRADVLFDYEHDPLGPVTPQ
jgi:outer membrane protein OmpA-like peptidoglycan-associated protein